MSILITKKRDLLPKLHKVINALVDMSADLAKLELTDNEEASKRARRDIIDIKNKYMKDLNDEITNLRFDLNTSKGRKTKRPRKQINPDTNE